MIFWSCGKRPTQQPLTRAHSANFGFYIHPRQDTCSLTGSGTTLMNMSSIIRFILTMAFSAAFSPSSPPLLRQPPQFAQNKILARQRQQFIGSTNTRTRPSFSIFANNKNNNVDDLPPIEERVLSCLPYMLPLLDGAHFGVFIEQRIAPLHILKLVFLQPFLNIYELIPFSSLILFLGFTFVTRNQGLSR